MVALCKTCKQDTDYDPQEIQTIHVLIFYNTYKQDTCLYITRCAKKTCKKYYNTYKRYLQDMQTIRACKTCKHIHHKTCKKSSQDIHTRHAKKCSTRHADTCTQDTQPRHAKFYMPRDTYKTCIQDMQKIVSQDMHTRRIDRHCLHVLTHTLGLLAVSILGFGSLGTRSLGMHMSCMHVLYAFIGLL